MAQLKHTEEIQQLALYVSGYMRSIFRTTFWRVSATHNEASKSILECKTTQMQIDADDLLFFPWTLPNTDDCLAVAV